MMLVVRKAEKETEEFFERLAGETNIRH